MENKNINNPTEAEISESYNEILNEFRRADARRYFAQYVGFDTALPMLDSKNTSAVNSFVERFNKNPLRLYLDNRFINACYKLFLAKSPDSVDRDAVWNSVFNNLAENRFEATAK